jgi:outer membrane protein assembly factor BamB
VVVSPDGTEVFAASSTFVSTETHDYISGTTLAFSASTGSMLWLKDATGGLRDTTLAGLTDPGSEVVAAEVEAVTGGAEFQTIAYDPATGAVLWTSTFKGSGAKTSGPEAIAASADGSTVFVTGAITLTDDDTGYETLAYDAATGALLWHSSYNVSATGGAPFAIATDGSQAFVTGQSENPKVSKNPEWYTLAYGS